MIPVFQTRYATETLGNCFEACVASVLEVPLSRIPDRGAFVDLDAWADLVRTTELAGGAKAVAELEEPAEIVEAWYPALYAWLDERGLGLLELDITSGRFGMSERQWLETHRTPVVGSGYWIGVYRRGLAVSHALVCRRGEIAHNPTRGDTLDRREFGDLVQVYVLTCPDPAKAARILAGELLPDVAGVLEAVA